VSGIAHTGCGLEALVDEFGFVGSGGGREVLGDAGLDGASGPDDASREASRGFEDAQDGAEHPEASSGVDGGEPETGAVAVEASIVLEKVGTSTQCPGISVFSIAPAGLSPGQLAQLTVVTVGPPAAVHWSVSPPSGGAFSSTTALMPTFQCAGAGPMVVTVTAGLADSGSCEGARFTSYSGEIDCQN
jgi:hypothetical protein